METLITQAVRPEETLQNRCTDTERVRPTEDRFPRALHPAPKLRCREQACPPFPTASISPLIPLAKTGLVDLFPHLTGSHSCTLSAAQVSHTAKSMQAWVHVPLPFGDAVTTPASTRGRSLPAARGEHHLCSSPRGPQVRAWSTQCLALAPAWLGHTTRGRLGRFGWLQMDFNDMRHPLRQEAGLPSFPKLGAVNLLL